MVAAHQELGERFGTELADSFIERLHAAIDRRIKERVKNRKGSASPLVLPVLSLLAGLPAMAIAANAMGGVASPFVILSPWLAIIVLNIIWAVGRRD